MAEDRYGTAEIQAYLKDLLVSVHSFCVANGIEYSVWDGTLLGAIRHKGFIPWDDDVDIILDRENYRKFMRACEHGTPGFTISRRLWIKRIEAPNNRWQDSDGGVIDIFIFDSIPDNKLKKKAKKLFLKCLQGMMKERMDPRGKGIAYYPVIALTYAVGRLFSDSLKYRWYDAVSQWGNEAQTVYRGVYNEPFAYVGKVEYNNRHSRCLPMPFEDTTVMVLEDYDDCLKRTYGDYMSLPPEADRVPQHV